MDALLTTALIIGAITAIVVGVTKTVQFFAKISRHVDDLVGEEARPGVPARPGIMQRLENIEHELTTNSGSSLKDAVRRIEANQEELRKHFTGGNPE